MRTTITDDYGDTLEVTVYTKIAYLDATEGPNRTEIALDRKAAKKLRKLLKPFVKGTA
jgi:hypothetical protein